LRLALYFRWKYILRFKIIVIIIVTFSVLKNEYIFDYNWFAVVVYELRGCQEISWYACTTAPNIFRKVFNAKKPLLKCG